MELSLRLLAPAISARRDRRVPQDQLVQLALQDQRVRRDRQEQLVLREPRVRLVQREQQVRRVLQDQPDPPDQPDLLERKAER